MAKSRVAINGFGRIGKLAFREMWNHKDLEVVAINWMSDIESLAYFMQYDSAQGKFMEGKVKAGKDYIQVGTKKIKVVNQRDPKLLPWKELKIDLVIDSTGAFRDAEKLQAHIEAGAKKVLLSAPGKGMKTIVYGVNHEDITKSDKIVSGASCTTNCLAPVANVLDKVFGIEKGYMTTVHAYTNDQNILDRYHEDPRRSRAGAANIIPTTTGAASAVGQVLPQLKGRLDGIALRVPVITGSCVDLVVELKKNTTAEKVNAALKKAKSATLGYTDQPIVSTDIIGDTHGGMVDSLSTMVMEVEGKQLVKVLVWYDNEYSYTAQLIRTAAYMTKVSATKKTK